MRLLTCHYDSYCTQAQITVTGCDPVEGGFRVSVSESIAYPGGGGQPADSAQIGDALILDYFQDADMPAVLTDRFVNVGPAMMTVDWPRRFDHMQQHTAQHLITATAVGLFGWETLAFHLNEDRSDIVLDTPIPSKNELTALENEVNRQIRAAIDVGIESMERDELARSGARFRRLAPGDGALRMIRIGQVDLNPCGGTHVRNTSELQMIRFVGAQPDKGKTRLFFLAGQRLIADHRTLQASSDELTGLLSEPARHHRDAVERLQGQVKDMSKKMTQVEERLAEEMVAQITDDHWVYSIERTVLRPAFVSAVGRMVADAGVKPVVFVHDAALGGDMNFVLFGAPEDLDRIMASLGTAYTVRGGGRGTRRQGKVVGITEPASVVSYVSNGGGTTSGD